MMSESTNTMRDFGRYLTAIWCRESLAQGIRPADRKLPKTGDRVELRGKTYEFFFVTDKDGNWKTLTRKVDANSPIRKDRLLVIASGKPTERTEETTSEPAASSDLPF